MPASSALAAFATPASPNTAFVAGISPAARPGSAMPSTFRPAPERLRTASAQPTGRIASRIGPHPPRHGVSTGLRCPSRRLSARRKPSRAHAPRTPGRRPRPPRPAGRPPSADRHGRERRLSGGRADGNASAILRCGDCAASSCLCISFPVMRCLRVVRRPTRPVARRSARVPRPAPAAGACPAPAAVARRRRPHTYAPCSGSPPDLGQSIPIRLQRYAVIWNDRNKRHISSVRGALLDGPFAVVSAFSPQLSSSHASSATGMAATSGSSRFNSERVAISPDGRLLREKAH